MSGNSELPTLEDAPMKGLRKLSFWVDGFFACAYMGVLHRWADYVRQARLETGDFTNKGWQLYGNPFSMHVGDLSSRRNAEADYDGGGFAVYTGWGASWRAWLDRIEWDEKRGIAKDLKADEYKRAVVNGGYLGYNTTATSERGKAYIEAWKAKGGALIPELLEKLGAWINVLVIIAVTGVTVYLIAKFWKRTKRKRWRQ